MSEPLNPYAAPSGSQHESHEPVFNVVVPAGQGARFLNLIIDYFAQMGITFAFGVIVVVIAGQAGVDFIDSTPGLVIGIPILLGYYFVFEATTSRTLGKLVTGTKVVNENGGKATLGQITGRTFARLIPFEAFSFLGTPTRGWHDSLPRTFVIKSR